MNAHIVQRGDSLSSIARRNDIRFWANIYLAGENDNFRLRRGNPNLIKPGDRIVIPPKASISKLEARARVNHKLPKLFTQPTLDLCWQACAKMLYCWKHRGRGAEADFQKKLGDDYNKPGGLRMADRLSVLGKLGLDWGRVGNINQLHQIVLARGPLWVAEINGSAHAQILTGYNLITCEWYLLDPLGKGQTMTFDTGMTITPKGATEGAGRVTGGATGRATLKNMSRKRGINSMAIDDLVFGYGDD